MVKKTLRRLVWLVPRSFEEWLRERYWQAKSALLYRRLYQILQLEYTLESGLVLKVASKGEWWTYNDIFVNHEYDLPIQKALESHASGCPLTVLDLGANVGYFALRVVDLMRHTPLKITATDMTLVEGSPATYLELEDRLELQSLPQVNLRVVHGLVGHRDGVGIIHESAIHVKNTIMGASKHGGVSVGFVDLSKLMENKREIDLLKCDIEGAEQLFIENYGDLLHKVRHAVFEFHHEQCDTAKCVSVLEQKGFRQRVLRSSDGVSICFFSRS
jgi:FkbM family methyltransferase